MIFRFYVGFYKIFSPLDIAHRWQSQEASNPGLPKNVVQNLRKVMNKEGRLSFERFCAGLKISILRHEAERNKVDKRNKVNMQGGPD